MINVLTLSGLQIALSLGIGAVLSCVYLGLLWLTLINLHRFKHKGNILFLSAVVRLAVLIFTAVFFSFSNGSRFLLIFIGFLIVRLLIVKRVQASVKNHLNKEKTK